MRNAVQLGRDRPPCAFLHRIIEEKLIYRELVAGHNVGNVDEIHHAQTVLRHEDTVAYIHSQERVIRGHEGINKHSYSRLIDLESLFKTVLLTQLITALHLLQRLIRLRRKTEGLQKHHEKKVYINDLSHFHPTKIGNNYIKRR